MCSLYSIYVSYKISLASSSHQMSQLNAELSFMREQLLTKKSTETQNLNTEVQNLLTRIASLEEEKTKLLEVLESAREEAANLRRDLEESEQTVSNAGSKFIVYTGFHWSCLKTLFPPIC